MSKVAEYNLGVPFKLKELDFCLILFGGVMEHDKE